MKFNIYEEINKLSEEYLNKYNLVLKCDFLDKFPNELEGDFSKIKKLFDTVIDFFKEKEKDTIEVRLSKLKDQIYISIYSKSYKIDKKELDLSFLDEIVDELDSVLLFNCSLDFGLEFMFVFDCYE